MMINIQPVQRAIRMAQRMPDHNSYSYGEILRSAEAALDGTDDGAARYLDIIASAGAQDEQWPAHFAVIFKSAQALLDRHRR